MERDWPLCSEHFMIYPKIYWGLFSCLLVIFTCLGSCDLFLQTAALLVSLFLPLPPYPGGTTSLLRLVTLFIQLSL